MSAQSEPGFDIQAIHKILPHRYPFALIDRVIGYVPGESLHAIKNITMNEPVFNGHFPDRPIFPGVLLVEAMAQATGLLGFKMIEHVGDNDFYLLAGIDKTRFKRQVVPGDQVHFHVTFLKERRGLWRFAGRAEVDGKVVCSAELMCARTNV